MTEHLSTETPSELIHRLESIQSCLITVLTHCSDTDTTLCFYEALEPISLALSELSHNGGDTSSTFPIDTRLTDLERLLTHAQEMSPSANGVWHAHLARISRNIASGWCPINHQLPNNQPHGSTHSQPARQTPGIPAVNDSPVAEAAPAGVEPEDPQEQTKVAPASTSAPVTDAAEPPVDTQSAADAATPVDPFADDASDPERAEPRSGTECNGLTDESKKRDCQAAKELEQQLWNEWDYLEAHDMDPIERSLRILAIGFGLHQRKALLARAHQPDQINSRLYDMYISHTAPSLPAIPHGVDAEYARRSTKALLTHLVALKQMITDHRDKSMEPGLMKRITTEVQVLLNAILPLDQRVTLPGLDEWIDTWYEISKEVKAPAMHREVRSADVRDAEAHLPQMLNTVKTAVDHAQKQTEALDIVAQCVADLEYDMPDAIAHLTRAIIGCRACNIPYTHKELREILSGCSHVLANPDIAAEWCDGLNLTQKQARTYICDVAKSIQEESKRRTQDGHHVLKLSEYESQAKVLCQDKRMLVISFHRNHERPDRLKERLGFAEVHWPDLDSHDHSTGIKQLISGHDLVVVDVRGCRTHWSKEIPGHCEQEGIPCLRLPRGVGIGHISQQIVEHAQCLTADTEETSNRSVTI